MERVEMLSKLKELNTEYYNLNLENNPNIYATIDNIINIYLEIERELKENPIDDPSINSYVAGFHNVLTEISNRTPKELLLVEKYHEKIDKLNEEASISNSENHVKSLNDGHNTSKLENSGYINVGILLIILINIGIMIACKLFAH